MSTTITYITGDATQPTSATTGHPHRIICHICNDIGGWGAGFVLAISKRWKLPEQQYRAWHAGRSTSDEEPFDLGSVQFVTVEPTLTIANMIAQHGIKRGPGGTPPVRYEAIRTALGKVATHALQHHATIHMPRIGAGLAGGDWPTIESIIQDQLASRSIPVTIYDLPQR